MFHWPFKLLVAWGYSQAQPGLFLWFVVTKHFEAYFAERLVLDCSRLSLREHSSSPSSPARCLPDMALFGDMDSFEVAGFLPLSFYFLGFSVSYTELPSSLSTQRITFFIRDEG